MNEAYLNLGFPMIVNQDEWIQFYCQYFDTGQFAYVVAVGPNQAIEKVHALGHVPLVMRFGYAHSDSVFLYYIKK